MLNALLLDLGSLDTETGGSTTICRTKGAVTLQRYIMDLSRLKPVHEGRILLLALAAGLPAVVTAMIILWWLGDYTPKVQWTLSVVIVGAWWGFAAAVRERVASPLRTLAESARSHARRRLFHSRARGAQGEEALGDVMAQVNEMAATLRAQRLGALEATTLLRKVMEEIDVAIFAFDGEPQTEAGESRGGAPCWRSPRNAS